MQLTFERSSIINDVVVVVPEIFEDSRGFFMEVYRQDQFKQFGMESSYVQLNHSRSVKNVVRGLHFQWDPPMGKLMRVPKGAAFLVAVDIRKGSPTLGKWVGVEASAENRKQVFAPAGCARGFCVLSDVAEIEYLCTGIYNSRCESGIAWNDPTVNVQWPVKDPILSAKDVAAQSLSQWLQRPEADYFHYQ